MKSRNVKTIIEVGGEKMEALYRIILNKESGRFYIKKGRDIVCRGTKGGDFCHIGKSTDEDLQILEFVQYYPRERTLCLRSIIRFEFNTVTHRCTVRIKGDKVFVGKVEGIARDGKNETYPHLTYYALVKKIA